MSQKHTKRMRGDVDPALLDARETDIVIPIMGATGAGKSSFINFLLDAVGNSRHRVRVGDHLSSCTSDIEAVVIEGQTVQDRARFINITESHRLVVVDTPGFDDTAVPDSEIRRRIARWLQESYKTKMILGGFVYLHDISQDRLSGTAQPSLDMFDDLCAEAALDKVVLVTTKWSRDGGRGFAEKEEELKDVHWKGLLRNADGGPGAHIMRLDPQRGEDEGAWDVIDHILAKLDRRMTESVIADVLQIQEEVLKKRWRIPGTRAEKQLREQLEAALQAQEKERAPEAQAADGGQAAKQKIRQGEAKSRETRAADRVSYFSGFRAFWKRWIHGGKF